MRKTLLTGALCLSLGLGLGTLATAGDGLKAPTEPITIEGKKPATFDHQTHMSLGLDCGTCHHNAEHQPLSAEDIAALPSADKLACENCHNKDFKEPKLQKRMNVFHTRCKDCHQKGVDGKKGPTKCSDCHVKKKRRAIEGC